jgi:hypothetical protein
MCSRMNPMLSLGHNRAKECQASHIGLYVLVVFGYTQSTSQSNYKILYHSKRMSNKDKNTRHNHEPGLDKSDMRLT